MKLKMKISSLESVMIKILSQKVCPKCDQLFQYLKFGLQNQYADKITVIKKEENETEFYALANQFNIIATPAIIINDKVLTDCSPLKVGEFLKQHV